MLWMLKQNIFEKGSEYLWDLVKRYRRKNPYRDLGYYLELEDQYDSLALKTRYVPVHVCEGENPTPPNKIKKYKL